MTTTTNLEDLKQEIIDRRDDLKFEYGDNDFDIVKINDILRDEFSDPEYEEALIELGINEEDTGVREIEKEESTIGGDVEGKDGIFRILLEPEKHIRNTELRLKGYEEERGKMVKKSHFLIPRDEIKVIIQLIESLYLPQNLIGKLNMTLTQFDDTYNKLIHNTKDRLEDYPDHICCAQGMKKAIDILLGEIQVVRNAIISGRLGDILRDISIGSYNEKNESKIQDESVRAKLEELKRV